MTNTINILNAKVDELRKLQPISIEAKKELENKFRLEFNYNSNHIEGNTLTYGETKLLLIFEKTQGDHNFREYEEMKSHDVALKLIKEFAKEKDRFLTEQFIKNINKIILVKPFWKEAITTSGIKSKRLIKVGNYKEHPNSVLLKNGEIFEYASVTDTPILMRDLINWFKKEEEKNELHVVALASLLHYKFVRIHPFDDGNGRIARLLMNYVLYKHDLPPVIIKSEQKEKYLDALNKADSNDINAFIEYVAKQLIWSIDLSIKAAKGESIEEKEDIDKELSIWKKQLKSNPIYSTPRDNTLIKKLYYEWIKELFEYAEMKHSKFNDLFFESEMNVYVNNNGKKGIMWVHQLINSIDQKKSTDNKNIESILSLRIQFYYYEYKNIKIPPFAIESNIKIDFSRYSYKISFGNDEKIIKYYIDDISSQEINHIVDNSVRHLFKSIKDETADEFD